MLTLPLLAVAAKRIGLALGRSCPTLPLVCPGRCPWLLPRTCPVRLSVDLIAKPCEIIHGAVQISRLPEATLGASQSARRVATS